MPLGKMKRERDSRKKESRRYTFAYNFAKGVVSNYFDLCGGKFLAEFVVGSSELSFMILDTGGGVFMRSLGHDGV
jgi:hypothetical protein